MQEALESLKRGDYDDDLSNRQAAWNQIINAIAYEGDNPESDNMDYVCQNDIMAAVAKECSRNPLDDEALEPMTTVTTMICLSNRNAAKVSSSPEMIKGLMRLVKEKIPGAIGNYALTSLTNLALHPDAHKNLLDAGALQTAINLLHYLDGSSDSDLDVGLTSASFICRVVGKEESGPGPDAIKANTKLVEKLCWILKTVLDAGPNGRVIGYHWDPGNILSDVATLATSDRNKPLLVELVLQLVRALELRSDNHRAARLAIIALSQLSFEPRCKPKFDELKDRLNTCLDLIDQTFPEEEAETKKNAQVLKATLNDSDKKKAAQAADKTDGKGGASRWGRLAKAVTGGSFAKPKGHVMFSYQWDAQPITKDIEKRLREAGVKTWYDLNDMGDNINDSMASAVENAICLLVFISRKYKESPNCRKECEMADTRNKPMIFIKVEKDYRPEAWLALIMGKALFVECFSTAMIPTAYPQIAKRVAAKVDQSIDTNDSAITTSGTVSPVVPTSSSSDSSGDVLGMLKTIMSQMAEMKTEIAEMKVTVQQLKGMIKN